MSLYRRDFLKYSGALALAALAGCESLPRAPLKSARVVVVGAGFGGATCARYLKRWAPELQVTLIEPDAALVSCPMSNWVIGGLRTMDDLRHGYASLDALGVQRVVDTVVGIDPGARTVRTQSGATLVYDRLVLAPGVEIRSDTVEGYAAAESAGRVVHAWKAGAQTALLRKQLESMPDGGVFVIAAPAAPYRCPPAPYERACMAAQYFKLAKPKSKIILLDGNPEIASKKALFEWAWATHYPGMIDYRPNNATVAVDADAMTVSTDFDDVRGDVLNVIPRQRAGALTALAGARNDSNGVWCSVNLQTFESSSVPFVHVIGDSVGSNLPKSGHMATSQAKVCAAAIVELLAGRAPDPEPVLANTCYSATSRDTAGYVANVFRLDPAKGYVSAPGGGSTERGDARNFAYAEAWAQNIWADVLGS